MTLVRVLCVLSIITVMGCPDPKTPPPDAIDSTPTPIPFPVNGDECERAEQRLKDMTCKHPDGQPMWVSKQGKPFAQFCRERLAVGDYINGNCVAQITDCKQVEEASRKDHAVCPTSSK